MVIPGTMLGASPAMPLRHVEAARVANEGVRLGG